MDHAGFPPAVVTAGGKPDPAAFGEFLLGAMASGFAGRPAMPLESMNIPAE